MEKIKGLAIDLNLDHMSVDRGLKGLKDRIKSVNAEMRANMSAFDRSERSVQKYQTRLDGLNKKLEVQKRAVEEARKEYEEMVKQHGHGSKEAEKAAREYNNQAAALNNLERYIERTREELAKLEREQRIANSAWTKVGERLENYGGQLKSVGSQLDNLGGRMTRSITMPVLGATTAVGGMVAAFGWGRLKSLDTAQAQLKGFGYTAQEVEVISEDVRNAVQGTTMTMAEGTSVAAGALAAGVKQGKELEKYIRRVGNAAIGSNRPVEEMAMIFNRVQGAGRLMTRELQMIEHGMPGFSQALAKHLGVAPEKLQEMVTAGKVTSKDFMRVMDNFAGDMAKEYAKTWDGMVANTKANIGIIGESFLRGVFQDSKKSLAEFLDMLRSPDIRRRAEEMGRVAQREFNRMKDAVVGVVDWYKNLDDSKKELIKRLGLMVVAGGPVLQLTGRLTSGLGSVFEITGKLSKAIGVARGAGLAAGLASLGPAGVAGLAVAGVGAVGLALYQLHKDSEQTLEDILKHTQARREEIDTLDETINAYEKLQEKNKLSSDEVLRYMDIMTELKNAKTEDGIKALTKEQEELLEKSGFTNEEMEEFLRLNGKIVEETPEATQKISEHGNAYAELTDEVRKLNETERERLRDETHLNLVGELQSQLDIIKEQEELQEKLAREEANRTKLIEEIRDKQEEVLTLTGEEREVGEIVLEDMRRRLGLTDERIDKLNKEIELNDKELEQYNQLLGEYEAIVLSEVNLTAEKGKGNEAIMQRQKEIAKTIQKLEEEHRAGKLTTEEFNKQNEELREEQRNLSEAKSRLDTINREIDIGTGKYKNQGSQIDNNNKKTDAGIKKEQERTREAGKDVTKNVNATDNKTVADIDRRATAPKSKTVNLVQSGLAALNRQASSPVTKVVNFVGRGLSQLQTRLNNLKFWEKGTPPSGHPGGHAIVGEKGSELITLPSGQVFLSPGTHTLIPNMPKGTHVIPHQETKRIIRNAPRYADGTRNWSSALGGSEFARLLSANSRVSDTNVVSSGKGNGNATSEMIRLLAEQNKLLMQLLRKNTQIVLNERVVGQELEPIITEIQQRNTRVRTSFT